MTIVKSLLELYLWICRGTIGEVWGNQNNVIFLYVISIQPIVRSKEIHLFFLTKLKKLFFSNLF